MNGGFFSGIECYHLTGTGRQLVNPFQALSNPESLRVACSEMLEHFGQRPLMNAFRQIAIVVEFRPGPHWNRASYFGALTAPRFSKRDRRSGRGGWRA